MAPAREVVAVVLTWRDRVGMFKRSRHMQSDPGKWHCITGFIEEFESPVGTAVRELFEETGLRVADLEGLIEGPRLVLADAEGNAWNVHTFHASTEYRHLRLNWEHDAFHWVSRSRVRRFDGRVPWLDDVVTSLGLTYREKSLTTRPARHRGHVTA